MNNSLLLGKHLNSYLPPLIDNIFQSNRISYNFKNICHKINHKNENGIERSYLIQGILKNKLVLELIPLLLSLKLVN